jgi:hypothetical protein
MRPPARARRFSRGLRDVAAVACASRSFRRIVTGEKDGGGPLAG